MLPCAENVPDHNLVMIMIIHWIILDLDIQVQDYHDQDYDDQVVPSAKIIPYDDDDEDGEVCVSVCVTKVIISVFKGFGRFQSSTTWRA